MDMICFLGLITNTEGQIAALIISACALFGQGNAGNEVYSLSNFQRFRVFFFSFLGQLILASTMFCLKGPFLLPNSCLEIFNI